MTNIQWVRGSAASWVLFALALIFASFFGWHLQAVGAIRKHAYEVNSAGEADRQNLTVSVNPLTNVVLVTRTIGQSPDKGNIFEQLGAAVGSALGGAVGKAMEPAVERELNLRAREQFDLYAMILPYKVRIVVGQEKHS